MVTLEQGAVALLLACAAWGVAQRVLKKSVMSLLPGPERTSWLAGNFLELFAKDGWDYHTQLYKKFGGAVKVHSLFGDEILYVTDPLAMYYMFVKDQNNYEQHRFHATTIHLTFGKNLFSSGGEEHRRMRKLLNPVFSLRYMRGLLGVFHPIARQLCEKLEGEVRSGKEFVDIMFWASRAAVEYIGQGGMGYSFDSLNKAEEHIYCDTLKRYMPAFGDTMLIRHLFLPWCLNIGTPEFRKWIIERVPIKGIQHMVKTKKVSDELCATILREKRDALAKGDAALAEQVGQGKDIISILLRENINSGLADEDILGQMGLFMFAGHDTTTSAMLRILYVLATHPEEQERLRAEVTAAFEIHGRDLEYDTLMDLTYLDAIARETFRIHPPVMIIPRMVVADTVLPLRDPIITKDGRKITEIPLKKGTELLASIYNANRSKAIWGDDAEEWKPERWLSPLPSTVTDARYPGVYSYMMTFLGGSKACIGFKFAEMELKMIVANLVAKFRLEPGPEIAWEQNSLQSPTIAGSADKKPQLPLKLTLIKP